MKLNILFILVIGLIVTACSYSSDPSVKKNTDDLTLCASDSQCISVASGCCGCTAGGSNMAINKDKKEQWSKQRVSNCKDIICPAVISQDESCSATPMCIKGQCALSNVK